MLKEIVFAEREVESAKIELALKSDFNLADCFRMFDVKSSGLVTEHDFADALSGNLNFHDFSADDVFLLFRRYDRQAQGFLTFTDFSKAVLPFSREYANLITDRSEYYSRRTYDYSTYFNKDTRAELGAFWSVLIRTERAMEALRMRLAHKRHIALPDMFAVCARSRPGMVLSGDLRDALAENGFYSTERELMGLMFRLDRDMDGCVSYDDFLSELTPHLR